MWPDQRAKCTGSWHTNGSCADSSALARDSSLSAHPSARRAARGSSSASARTWDLVAHNHDRSNPGSPGTASAASTWSSATRARPDSASMTASSPIVCDSRTGSSARRAARFAAA